MKNLFNIILCTIFLFTGCSEEVMESYTNDEVPEKVVVLSVENGSGRSRINLQMPDSKSLLFVEAVYEDKGKTIIAKASAFNSFIDLEGFSESKDFNVKLYSVSRGMNKSEAVDVTVSPKKPPYISTFEQMDAEADFGGFNLNFNNEESASLAVFLEKFNPQVEEWEALDAFYYQDPERTIFVRNQVGQNLKYRLRVRDKFLNYSEFKEFTITPWVESEMDYSKFTGYPLPNDPPLFTITGTTTQPYNYLWNQVYFNGFGTESGSWIGTTSSAHPITGGEFMMTFDLGKVTKLTRLVIYQRGIDDSNTGTSRVNPYTSHNIRDFEVYGSNNPAADGSWASWDKILIGSIIKPAGTNAEILEIAKRGDAFNFEKSVPAYRYLRIKQLRSFNTNNYGNFRFFLAGIRLFENSNY